MEDTLYIIKGKFKGEKSKNFGIFLIIIRNSTVSLELVNAVVSHYSELLEKDVNRSWYEIEKCLAELKWNKKLAHSLTKDMLDAIENLVKLKTIDDLILYLREKKYDMVQDFFESLISRVYMDNDIKLELYTDIKDNTEFIKEKEDIALKTEKEKKDDLSNEEDAITINDIASELPEPDAVIIPVNHVIAPVSGKFIFDIQQGDVIMVKISPESEKGKYFINLMGLQNPETKEIQPVKAEIVLTKINELNERILISKIGPGIYGKSIESERVKLKLYDPITVKEHSFNVSKPSNSSQTNIPKSIQEIDSGFSSILKSPVLWVLGIILISFTVFILYLYFSGIGGY